MAKNIFGDELEFDPEGSGFDLETFKESGGVPDKTGHMGSLDPRTGMLLKGISHPTIQLTLDEEERLGNKIIRRGDRFFSVSKNEAQVNAFGDPIESAVAVLPEPTKEPIPPEQAFERAGKVWDAAVENEVPLGVAQEWFYDATITASDPDDFAEPVPDNRTGFSENFKREWTFEKGITKLPIAGGIIGLAQNAETIQAANRLIDSEFDYDAMNRRAREVHAVGMVFGGGPFFPKTLDSDRKRIAQAIKDFEFQSRGKTFGGKLAVSLSALPTWMLEFAATGGLAALGDDAARIAGQKLLGRYAATKFGKTAIKGAGLVTGAVVRTSTGLLPRVGEKATARQVLIDIGLAGEENWATSLAKAWGDVAIESLSEQTGGIITKNVMQGLVRLPFGGKFISSLQDDWIKLFGGTSDDFVSKLITKGGYSNILGEMSEERLSTLLREATGVSDRRGTFGERIWEAMKEDFDPENLGVEFLTVLAPTSVKRGMTIGVSLTPGVSVPTEAEQVDQAVGVGPIQFDTLADAQGYASKATEVAEREDKDVTVTVDSGDKTVTVTSVAEEKAVEEQAKQDEIVSEARTEIQDLLQQAESEKDVDKLEEIADQLDVQDKIIQEVEGRKALELEDKSIGQLRKIAKDAGIDVPKGTKPGRLKSLITGEFLQREAAKAGIGVERLSDGKYRVKVTEGNVTRSTDFGTVQEAFDFIKQTQATADQAQQDIQTEQSRINGLSYRDLQSEAKDAGIKANQKKSALVRLLKGRVSAEKPVPAPDQAVVDEPAPGVQPEGAAEAKAPKRIITKETYEAARDRIRSEGKLKTGLDPQDFIDLATVGAYHFETGARKFAEWSKKMITDFGEKVKPHLQEIFDKISKAEPVSKAEKPKKKPAKKKVKKPKFPKNQSVDKAEQAILGEDPIQQILSALKKAVAVAPKTEAEKKAELSRRVGAAAGALRSNVKQGMPTVEALFKSTGLLKGPLTEYEQVFQSIEDQLTPETKEAAYAKISSHPGLKYFEVLNTSNSFTKLIQGTALTPGDVTNIENVFGKMFSEVTDIRQQISDLYEIILTLWKAGLLTGIKTTGLNIISNAANAMAETAALVPTALVDNAISLYTGERTRAFTVRGYGAGVVEGILKGWKYLRTGYSERNIGEKLDYKETFFGTSKFARALQAYEEFIFHLLGAEDQPFYYGSKGRSVRSQAIAKAINEGLKGKERDQFVKDFIRHPTDEVVLMASEDAKASVFQNRTNVGDAARAVSKVKPFGFIIPFTRTPSSIAVQIVSDYTPIGAVKELLTQIKKGELDQAAISKAFGKSIVGTGALFVGGALVTAGLMTLDRPKDERERKLWELENRKANSIKVGGKWRSVQVLGPLGSTLIIGGHFQRELEKTGSPTKAMIQAMAGGAKSFSEQTFVRGLNQSLSAIADPERSAERWFTSMAGSIVPTLVADIARAADETERRTEGAAQRIRSRIPVLRESLPPRIDVFGQDLPRYGGNVLEVMIDPSRPFKIKSDVVVDELRRLADNDIKVTPTLLGDRAGFDVLTAEENTQLWRRSGELTYKILLAWINSEGYKNIPNDFTKGETIESLVKKTKAAAKAEIVGIKLKQGVSVLKLAESGLLSIDGLDALQFFTK